VPLGRGGGIRGAAVGAVRAPHRSRADPTHGRGSDRPVHAEFAKERRDRAAEGRHFDIEHDQVSFAGTSRVYGELDLADALDLEDAVATGAAELAALGNTDSLDVRGSLAVGVLARGQQPLDLTLDGAAGPDPLVEEVAQQPSRSPGRGCELVLFVHLSDDALRSHDPNAVARLENASGQLLTARQVAEWCHSPDTGKVTMKPVIDLNQPDRVDGYQVPARIAEQVRLRDKMCVHPYCHRPARRCDLDHIDPYNETGPPGQTSSDNLASR
jgi:hypothetical protein